MPSNHLKYKVLFIDPWGVNNTSDYTNGIVSGLSDYVNLTLVTNYYFKKELDGNYKLKRVFFLISEHMKHGISRRVIRGIEYFLAYIRIIFLVWGEKYDIVHINWLLQYKIDYFFLGIIKKFCNKLIYTAHNVLPHTNSFKYINDMRKIYCIVDCIIVHGYAIKEEFLELFPEYTTKLYVQRHGCNSNADITYNKRMINPEYLDILNRYSLKFLVFGRMFYNKGTDRVVRLWTEKYANKDALLVIAGEKDLQYKELTVLESKIKATKNILYINSYVDNNLLNCLINNCDIILIPYRHASMSGVVFTTADFSKPVMITKTGALYEYTEDGVDSYVVDNDDKSIEHLLDELFNDKQYIVKDLKSMGMQLHKNIIKKYNWNKICKDLVYKCYKRLVDSKGEI